MPGTFYSKVTMVVTKLLRALMESSKASWHSWALCPGSALIVLSRGPVGLLGTAKGLCSELLDVAWMGCSVGRSKL